MEEKPEERIRQISSKSAEYPQKLNNYPKMPEILFAKGNLPDAKKPTAAIVGARACSPYGRIQAFRYAKILSSAGVQIISGMAYGIDAEAHKGALEGGTPTYAVLAGGVDICYPSGNRPLYDRILRENGGILSEQPPGMRARNYFFPARNRIISGLADLVLIVEAREKSGSLITAQWALDQGKIVYAVPGAVNEALSMGCHKLIYDGAGIAYSPEILLRELGLNCENKVKSPEKNDLGLASDLKLVYSCLDLRPKNPDYIVRKTGFSPAQVSNCLVELTLRGLIRESGRHYYVKDS